MMRIRRSDERGRTKMDWLDSRHSFSFGEYFDPSNMGYSVLRVINDDVIAPGAGFGMHGHRDMEIVTWMLDGALRHQDSLGNGSVLRRGHIQRMSAGRGIRHSEMNDSVSESARLLQIWIEPSQQGIDPGYEERDLGEVPFGELREVATPDGRAGSAVIHQDARILVARLEPGQTVGHAPRPGRRLYLHVARGSMLANGQAMSDGDAAMIQNEPRLELRGEIGGGEALLFDLP
jgi:hypothetical protein